MATPSSEIQELMKQFAMMQAEIKGLRETVTQQAHTIAEQAIDIEGLRHDLDALRKDFNADNEALGKLSDDVDHLRNEFNEDNKLLGEINGQVETLAPAFAASRSQQSTNKEDSTRKGKPESPRR